MSRRLAYYRVSTIDQSIEAQRTAMGGPFRREFSDEGVSGKIKASERPGFAALLAFVDEGDTVCVYAIDRLGRDAIDVQQTVRDLIAKGVAVEVRGLGKIEGKVGELIVALLAQIAQMEHATIVERLAGGKVVARASLEATGKTHKGKTSLGGRPVAADAASVVAWRAANSASIEATAKNFGLGTATVKRYCAAAKVAAVEPIQLVESAPADQVTA